MFNESGEDFKNQKRVNKKRRQGASEAARRGLDQTARMTDWLMGGGGRGGKESREVGRDDGKSERRTRARPVEKGKGERLTTTGQARAGQGGQEIEVQGDGDGDWRLETGHGEWPRRGACVYHFYQSVAAGGKSHAAVAHSETSVAPRAARHRGVRVTAAGRGVGL